VGKRITYHQIHALFGELGLSDNSPEWKMALLSMLEINAKNHMLQPLIRKTEVYAGNAKQSGQPVPIPSGGDPKKLLESVILGNERVMSAYARGIKTRSGDLKSSIMGEREALNGTEYYRGMHDFIEDNLWDEARKKFPSSDTDPDRTAKALFAMKGAIFMKTSQRDKANGLSASELRKLVLDPLSKNDVDGALTEMKKIILDVNPDLYDEVIWEEPFLGLRKEEVRAHWEEKKNPPPPDTPTPPNEEPAS
jgi:hypothetical protein